MMRSDKLCGRGETVHGSGCCVVIRLGFSSRDVANGFEQAPLIEPVDPFQCCELDDLEGTPVAPPVDHFCPVGSTESFSDRANGPTNSVAQWPWTDRPPTFEERLPSRASTRSGDRLQLHL